MKDDKTTATQESHNIQALDGAVKAVNDAIDACRKALETIASGSEQDLIMLEGQTYTDHMCHLLVDPKEVAIIILSWNYPTYEILGEEAPTEMWQELAEHFGIKTVNSFDL